MVLELVSCSKPVGCMMAHTRDALDIFDPPPLSVENFDLWRFHLTLTLKSFDFKMWDVIDGVDCKDRFDYLNSNALSIITNSLSGEDTRIRGVNRIWSQVNVSCQSTNYKINRSTRTQPIY